MNAPIAFDPPTRTFATFPFVTPAPEPGSMRWCKTNHPVEPVAPPNGPRIAQLRRLSGVTGGGCSRARVGQPSHGSVQALDSITIPRGDPINAYTMGGIVTDAGLGVEEFKKLL